MKGKISIEYEGGRYEREFAIDDDEQARAILKEIVSEVGERFLKGSRPEPGAIRRKPAERVLNAATTNAGGEA